MRKLKVVIVVLSFFMATLPAALWAQSPSQTGVKPNYVVLKGGIYIPEANDMSQQDAGNGFVGRVAFGYYVTPYFSVEAALGYQDFKASTGYIERTYQMIPLEIAGKLGIPLGFVEPYLAFGIGGYYITAKAGNYQEDSYRAGFFGGGGVNFNLSQTLFIGVEARYLWLEAYSPYYTTPYSYAGKYEVNLDGVMVTGNLGFRF